MLSWNPSPLIGQKWSRGIYQPMRMLKIQRSINLRWKYFYKIGSRFALEGGLWHHSVSKLTGWWHHKNGFFEPGQFSSPFVGPSWCLYFLQEAFLTFFKNLAGNWMRQQLQKQSLKSGGSGLSFRESQPTGSKVLLPTKKLLFKSFSLAHYIKL